MRKLIKLSAVTAVLSVMLAVLFLSVSIYTFTALTDETLIAEVRFERAGANRNVAYLRTGDMCAEQVLGIVGDQWRIDAEFVKWRYWASLLGLKSQYRLDRFEGRFRDIAEQNKQPSEAHPLGSDTALDIVSFAESLGPLNFLVDASYGSSTYETIDVGRKYSVYKSPTGIFTRSSEVQARADSAGLAVEIRRGCAQQPGMWKTATVWLDKAVAQML
jgi:hypothetical protein